MANLKRLGSVLCLSQLFVPGIMSSLSYGHGGKHAGPDANPATSSPSTLTARLNQIAAAYRKDIEPIFAGKCLDCHGSSPKLPWYSKIPGPKQLIQHDVTEAKVHLDMSTGFPFKGHGDPKGDLQAIRDSIDIGSMPPFRYRLLHAGSAVTSEEKQTVNRWVDQSLKLLSEP